MMELQSGESQFPAVGSKLRFEGSDEDQKQIICKLRSSVFVLEIICLFFNYYYYSAGCDLFAVFGCG